MVFRVDCGSNSTGLFWDTYEGASPRARGRPNEAGGKVRVEGGVCFLRVQSVRAGLDRLCSGRELDFKGVRPESMHRNPVRTKGKINPRFL